MFDRIAPRYDLLNHVLSCNVDRTWWWRTARRFRHILARPEARVLDICCGTGDMTRALLRRRPANGTPVVAADFSVQMLARARKKLAAQRVEVIDADAMRLPFNDGSLDLITTAFGFRNLANYQAGLAELFRVLAPGGEVGILDCSKPGGWVGRVFGFTFGICCRGWARARLFAVERESTLAGDGADQRQTRRQAHSRPILEELQSWIDHHRGSTPPKTPLGRALGYLHRQWQRLLIFLEDGNIEATNNRRERELRRLILVRKNWLFTWLDEGGERTGHILSMIATCIAHDVNPRAYLHLVSRLIVHGWPHARLRDLLPDRMLSPTPICISVSAIRWPCRSRSQPWPFNLRRDRLVSPWPQARPSAPWLRLPRSHRRRWLRE